MILIISEDKFFYESNGEKVMARHINYHDLMLKKYNKLIFVITLSNVKENVTNSPNFILNINRLFYLSKYLNIFLFILRNKNKIRLVTFQNFGIKATPIILICKLFNLKYALQIHTPFINKNYFLKNYKNFINFIFGLINIRLAYKIRVVSKLMKIQISHLKNNHLISVIPVPTINATSIINSTKKYDLIFIGRLTKEKNPFLFLKIIELNKNKGLLIGDGKQKNEILSLIKSQELNIVYYNNIAEDLISYYISMSKILLITSDYEGLSRVGIQALSVGVPVITSNCQGPSEYVRDNVNGYVIKSKNPYDYISKVNFLLKNGNIYKKFSNKSIEIGKSYKYERIINRYIDFLNE